MVSIAKKEREGNFPFFIALYFCDPKLLQELVQRGYIFLQVQCSNHSPVNYRAMWLRIREAGNNNISLVQVMHQGIAGRQDEHGEAMRVMHRGIGGKMKEVSDVLLQ